MPRPHPRSIKLKSLVWEFRHQYFKVPQMIIMGSEDCDPLWMEPSPLLWALGVVSISCVSRGTIDLSVTYIPWNSTDLFDFHIILPWYQIQWNWALTLTCLLLPLLLARFLWPTEWLTMDAYLHIIKFNLFFKLYSMQPFFHIHFSTLPFKIFVFKQFR